MKNNCSHLQQYIIAFWPRHVIKIIMNIINKYILLQTKKEDKGNESLTKKKTTIRAFS